jgi:hypothetical protein
VPGKEHLFDAVLLTVIEAIETIRKPVIAAMRDHGALVGVSILRHKLGSGGVSRHTIEFGEDGGYGLRPRCGVPSRRSGSDGGSGSVGVHKNPTLYPAFENCPLGHMRSAHIQLSFSRTYGMSLQAGMEKLTLRRDRYQAAR